MCWEVAFLALPSIRRCFETKRLKGAKKNGPRKLRRNLALNFPDFQVHFLKKWYSINVARVAKGVGGSLNVAHSICHECQKWWELCKKSHTKLALFFQSGFETNGVSFGMLLVKQSLGGQLSTHLTNMHSGR